MQHIDKKFIVLLAFLILGLLISIQVRSNLYNKSLSTSVLKKIDSYNKQLDEIKKKVAYMKKTIQKDEKKKDNYLRTFSTEDFDKTRRLLYNELNTAKLKAGLSDVKGKGIEIFMNDAPSRDIDDPSKLVIHSEDINYIINELKVAGAQAISINGERIISTSEQICAGPTIRINKNRYAIPYNIKAIGDPDKLVEAVENSFWVASMREEGITVDEKKYDNVQISKYNYNIEKLITGLNS